MGFSFSECKWSIKFQVGYYNNTLLITDFWAHFIGIQPSLFPEQCIRSQARGQVFAVLFGLLLWLPFTNSVLATVLALAWYGLAGGACWIDGATESLWAA